jgi:hypothetical protein
MKPIREQLDPGTRMIPRDWNMSAIGRGSASTSEREPYKWLTTLPAPLAEVRRCTLDTLSEWNSTLAYLYENSDKVVIRSTLPQRQIRAELKPLDARFTRIVVVTMQGSAFDRTTSGQIVDAIEHKLHDAGYLVEA